MSLRSSENNYKIAKSLYFDISDDFYEIENTEETDEYLIDQTLENIRKLNRHINRINIEELEEKYDEKVINVVDNNIDTFREASYFIERALMSMKLFDKLHPVLEDYIKNVNWKIIADTEKEAIMKFGRFLTSEDNYKQYRTIISNIVKGTMKKKAFKEFFNSISSRLSKPKKQIVKQRHFFPPEMWSEKERKEWEEQLKKRREESIEDDVAKFDDLGEGFISFKKYKKLFR